MVHPAAWVDLSVELGPGAVVFAGAVIQPRTVVGAHAIVNTAASIDHDCRIGRFAHLAPGVHLAGTVTVGDGAFLGIGTVAIPGVTIGEWTQVGAGAAVVRDLPARVRAVGVPARPLEEHAMTRMYLSPPHMSGHELELVNDAFASNWIAPLGPARRRLRARDGGPGRRAPRGGAVLGHRGAAPGA